MKYRLYHNIDAGYGRGYRHGDRLVDGYEGEIAVEDTVSAPQVAEMAYMRHNADDRPDGRTAPSLSMGDVVVVGTAEATLTVERLGFRSVDLRAEDLLGVPYLEGIES